jgi:hypothetical protein
MIPIISNIVIFFLILFIIIAGTKTVQDIYRQMKGFCILLLCSLSLSVFGQKEAGKTGRPSISERLQMALTEPIPEMPNQFQFNSPIYIETSDNDTTYYEEAKIFVDRSEFRLIRGTDTLSRRICTCENNVTSIQLTCGDWIRPRQDLNGQVYALRYREGNKSYYFSTKWRQRNLSGGN